MSDASLSEKPDDQDLRDWVHTFFRKYLVGLAGGYVPIGPDEKLIGDETFFCYSGFIYSHADEWYFVTAGHCLNELYGYLEQKKIHLTGISLIGLSGENPDESTSIPFHHYNDAPRHFVDEAETKSGIDYGWIKLRPYYQLWLEKAGVKPVAADDWVDRTSQKNWGEVVVGFPVELQNKDMNRDIESEQVRGEVEPVMISINQLTDVPDKYEGYNPNWFIGKVTDSCDLESIVGTSGGPIIQFYETDSGIVDFRIVALQSWWHKPMRIAFGSPIASVLRRLISDLEPHKQG